MTRSAYRNVRWRSSSAMDMPPTAAGAIPRPSCRLESENKLPIHQLTDLPLATFSPMRLVQVGADLVFRDRDRIVGEAVFVEAVAERVVVLFVGRAIAFDRTFVRVLIVQL